MKIIIFFSIKGFFGEVGNKLKTAMTEFSLTLKAFQLHF